MSPKKEKLTEQQRFVEAIKGGYGGSFDNWLTMQSATPEEHKKYEAAINAGYRGSLSQFLEIEGRKNLAELKAENKSFKQEISNLKKKIGKAFQFFYEGIAKLSEIQGVLPEIEVMKDEFEKHVDNFNSEDDKK